MGTSEQWAAWVQAIGSIAAVLAGFVVVRLQHTQIMVEKNQDRIESRRLMIFVISRCIEEYQQWVRDIEADPSNALVYKANGLRHLDVPLEELISTKVGNTDFNEALVVLRRVNADVWFQINASADAYDTDKQANLRSFSSRIENLIAEAEKIRKPLQQSITR